MGNKPTNIGPMQDLMGYIRKEQLSAIISACNTTRESLLIRILACTGRRISEILGRKETTITYKNGIEKIYPQTHGLRPCDIDFTRGLVRFTILKKKEPLEKLKVVDWETLEILKDYIETNNILPYKRIIPISRQRAYQIIQKIGQRAGIYMIGEKPLHPHHFRHTFAVMMAQKLKNPADVKKLKDLLEHSDLSTTEVYLQFAQEDNRELVTNIFKDL